MNSSASGSSNGRPAGTVGSSAREEIDFRTAAAVETEGVDRQHSDEWPEPGAGAYFLAVSEHDAPSVRDIMEANFRYNLSLEEYAKLCHHRLSSFKRDFQTHFQEAPGK